MKPLRNETLVAILEEFPSFPWDQKVLEELIDPKLGVITAFGDILTDIEALIGLDLDECGPCAPIQEKEKSCD